MERYLARFEALYEDLTIEKLAALPSVYTDDVQFQDPAHTIKGISALSRYFHHQCASLQYCRFKILQRVFVQDSCFVQWQMRFSHPNLARGKEVQVNGCSLLKLRDDGICQHTDYFDLGAMLYEQLPLLGRVIAFLKRRLAP